MPRLNASLVESVLAHLNAQDPPHRHGAIGITWPLPGEPDLRLLAELQPAPLALPATAADYSVTYHASCDSTNLSASILTSERAEPDLVLHCLYRCDTQAMINGFARPA